MKANHALTYLLTAGSLYACSSINTNLPSSDTLLKEITEQNGRACIHSNDIDGFGVLDDDVISVHVRRDEYYLVTTIYNCNSLLFSPQLGFAGDFAEFCGGGRDKVATADEVCPVRGVYKFDSRESAFEAFDTAEAKRAKIREALMKQANIKAQ